AVFLAASVVVVVGAPVSGAKRLAPSSPAVIDHVVVLMQENRSTDHYLGRLHFEGQPHFDPQPQGSSNPDSPNPTGPPLKVFHKPDYSEVTELNHSWNGTHDEPGNVVPISQYYADAAAGQLPQVSFVDPIFLASPNVENGEHPPANVQVGERFVSDAIHALFNSPNWSSSALFLTYDEHGGF